MKNVILLSLLLVSNTVISQTNKTTWKLYAGKRIVMKGIAGNLEQFGVSKTSKAPLKLKCYPSSNIKNWINTLILMDTSRTEIKRKVITDTDNGFIIDDADLSINKKIVVYISSKPSDPRLAAKVRVGTVPLVAIKLQN